VRRLGIEIRERLAFDEAGARSAKTPISTAVWPSIASDEDPDAWLATPAADQADADLRVHRFQLGLAAVPAAQPAAGVVAQRRSVDLKTIGLFALIQFPYTWKFIWAPLLDRYRLPLGRRRGWMLLSQVGLLCRLVCSEASRRRAI
jgi:hypothetical protein